MTPVKVVLDRLLAYSDEHGNRIEYAGPPVEGVSVSFFGRGNLLSLAPSVRVTRSTIRFDGDNGTLTLGAGRSGGFLRMAARVGQDASISIGDGVTATTPCVLSAVEGVTLTIGHDVMIAADCQIRCDDGHPIFDLATERRVNPAKNIRIGDHVWLGNRSMVLGGADIDNGSVIGMASLVKGRIPNNCIAAGTPARVVRNDIAWERPHLSLDEPYYKPDASTVRKSPHWAPTKRDPGTLRRIYHRLPAPLRRLLRRMAGRSS